MPLRIKLPSLVFETQRKRHQKYKTGLVSANKDWWPSRVNFFGHPQLRFVHTKLKLQLTCFRLASDSKNWCEWSHTRPVSPNCIYMYLVVPWVTGGGGSSPTPVFFIHPNCLCVTAALCYKNLVSLAPPPPPCHYNNPGSAAWTDEQRNKWWAEVE